MTQHEMAEWLQAIQIAIAIEIDPQFKPVYKK